MNENHQKKERISNQDAIISEIEGIERLLDVFENPQAMAMLSGIEANIKEYFQTQTQKLTELTKIGVALSSTMNLSQLLENIVSNARHFTNADGGTLYQVNQDENCLDFEIVQTESLNSYMGGLTGGPVTLDPIKLSTDDGKPNDTAVCAYVANSGKLVNIPDVYEAEGFDFEGAKKFDTEMNYRSQSLLVIPMRNHLGDVIGVLQLVNSRKKDSNEVIAFAVDDELLIESLASQAAVALTNAQLVSDLTNLFNSFIKTIAYAIDTKSKYTGDHIEKVANLTVEIAERINETKSGKYADVCFSSDEMEELRLAAWLHDTGKITSPEYVVDKATKLQTIFDRKDIVRYRFELGMANSVKDSNALRHLDDNAEPHVEIEPFDNTTEQLGKDLEFVEKANKGGEFMSNEKIEQLEQIAAKKINTKRGAEPLLTEDELYNLSIRKGTLTPEERNSIENHVVMTYELLSKLPFPKRIQNVPFIASSHHEKLNGKGYPRQLNADQIPLQVRIMTLADIFEALSSKGRPYIAKPKKMSQVLNILGDSVKDGELDSDLVEFFLKEKMHLEYAKKFVTPEQIDICLD